MLKRIIALVCAASMVSASGAAQLAPTASAANAPSLTVGSAEGNSGDEVSLKVSVQDNPGVWGMDIKIEYDKSVLTLTSVENGGFFSDSEWTKGNLNGDVYILSYEADDLSDITTASGELATLNFKISDTAPAGTYAVTASHDPGDCINISFDDINFDITNGSITVKSDTVAATGVTLDKNTLSLDTGKAAELTATVTPADATNKAVVWSSSDEAVATVDKNGKVTGVAKGTATITATTEDGGYKAECTVTVSDAVVAATGVSLDKSASEISVGNDVTLTATVTPANATNKTVVWSSSDEAVATVDKNGKVTGVAKGTATISATTEDGGFKAECTVTVADAVISVTGVSLDKTDIELEVAGTYDLTATVEPSDAMNKNVIWSSSDESVATVNADGVVTAVSGGQAVITATTEDGGKTATCTVKVTVKADGIKLDRTSVNTYVYSTVKLVATVSPADATNKNVIWSSSDESIATVNNEGLVTGLSAGTAVITATTEDGSFTAECTVTVEKQSSGNTTTNPPATTPTVPDEGTGSDNTPDTDSTTDTEPDEETSSGSEDNTDGANNSEDNPVMGVAAPFAMVAVTGAAVMLLVCRRKKN